MEDVAADLFVLFFVAPVEVEEFYTLCATDFEGLIFLRCYFVTAHFGVSCEELVGLNDAVGRFPAVARGIVFEYANSAFSDGLVDLADVLRHVLIYAVRSDDAGIVQGSEFVAQMAHAGRFVGYAVEHTLQGDGFVF